MNLVQFSTITNLIDQLEVEKVKLLGFYFLKIENKSEFTLQEIVKCFDDLHIPRPNMSRLRRKVTESRDFLSPKSTDTFKLHAKVITSLETEYPELGKKSDEIVSRDTILSESIYLNTRGPIVALAKQINACYENNIFDGCAVLMRRLMEILLLDAYDNLGIAAEIKDGSGHYFFLDTIIANAKDNNVLNLSRNTRSDMEIFRKLGNFSAHKRYFSCSKKSIADHIINYEAIIQELLIKAGIRT